MLIVDRLIETLPEEPPGMAIDDPEFAAELERRSHDLEGMVPVSELFKKT